MSGRISKLPSVEEGLKRWGGKESFKIEYKLCKNKLSKDIWETVSSFANTSGGLILLGYKKEGTKYIPEGVKDPEMFSSPGSELRNPLTSSVFYDLGWAETKGTGIKTAIEQLKKDGYPLPQFHNDIKNDTFTLILPHPFDMFGREVTPQVTAQVTEQVTEEVMEILDRRAKVLQFCKTPRKLREIMEFLGLKHRPTFMENVLNPLLKAGKLRRTIPDKPRSRFQKYLTVKEKEQ